MTKKDILTVKGLTKEFIRGISILNDISFSVKEGESFGFLGKSGSGKSVLMQIIKGVEGYEPTYGSIIYDISYCPSCYWVDRPSMAGESCPRCSTKLDYIELDYWDGIKRQDRVALGLFDRVSLMPQRGFALYSEISALENVMKTLEAIGYPSEKRKARAIELLNQVRMGHRVNHIARNLSGGEKQRVIFALSLAKAPILFLADEPTGTLDPITSEMIHNVIKDSISKSNISFILTSHWPETVKILSNQAALLEYGNISLMGDPDEVYNTFLGQIEKMEIERKEGGEPIIQVEDVKKHYYTFDRGLTKAVDGVSINIKDGEILGLVGLSGSGKTSLADMIMGIKPVTSGSIKVRINNEWVDMKIPGPEGRGTATRYMDILHQEYSLHEGEIVLENLVGGVRKDISEEEKLEIAYDVMRSVNFTDDDIDKILYMYPGELSEGERHRVSIAMSLAKQPKIVLLDEPTGTADPITRMEIAKGIKNARDQLGQTYMIISHDIDFIKIVTDRAMYMREGKIVDVGDPDYIVDLMIKTEKANLAG